MDRDGWEPLSSRCNERLQTPPKGILSARVACCLAVLIVVTPATAAVANLPVNARFSDAHIPVDPAVPAYCTGWYGPTEDPFFLEVDLFLRDPQGNVIESAWDGNFFYAEAGIQGYLNETGDWRCDAHFYMDGFPQGGDEAHIALYLLILDVTINTFIPDNHYPCPPIAPCHWYGDQGWTGAGDDRSWNRHGSSRTYQIASIIQPRTSIYLMDSYTHGTGLSETYDIATSVDGAFRLTGAARNDWVPGHPMKIEWGAPAGATLSCGSSKQSAVLTTLDCYGNEATPLMWWAPGITYELKIEFWFHADDGNQNVSIEYAVSGSHDGFPNYEVYVGNQLLYSHNYQEHGQSIISLGDPMEWAGIYVAGAVW